MDKITSAYALDNWSEFGGQAKEVCEARLEKYITDPNNKLTFYEAFLNHCTKELESGKKLIVCGDFNTAHKEIDLSRPKENQKNSGFLKIEREWIDSFIENGFVDVFRNFNKEPNWYTYWDQKSRARDRNVGWRIDYFFVHKSAITLVKGAKILNKIEGSDHCPIMLDLV